MILEEVLHELRLPVNFSRRSGFCVATPDRARVEMTDAHHHAAHDHQRGGREPELLGSEQGRDHHVAARLELTVDLHDDAVAQIVEQQRLLGLGEPEFPGAAGMLERG